MKFIFFIGVFLLFEALIGIYFGVNGCCNGIQLILGFVFVGIGFHDIKSNISMFAGIALIEVGIVCFLTVFVLYNYADQWNVPVKNYPSGMSLTIGNGDIMLLAFLGIISIGGGIFSLNPPELAYRWGQESERKRLGLSNKVSIMDNKLQFHQPSWSSDKPEDWNIDALMQEVLRADTSLAELVNTDADLRGKIQTTLDFYNPNSGVFGSWAGAKRSENRVKFLETLNKEQRLIIEQALIFEQQVREGKKREIEHKMFALKSVIEIFSLGNRSKFEQRALSNNMQPVDFSAVSKEEELRKIRLKELEAISEIEQKAEDARIERSLKSANAYKKSEDTLTDDLREKRKKALMEIDEIEARTDISDRTKAAWKIDKENEAENLRRRIEARDRKAVSDEESFM